MKDPLDDLNPEETLTEAQAEAERALVEVLLVGDATALLVVVPA